MWHLLIKFQASISRLGKCMNHVLVQMNREENSITFEVSLLLYNN